MNGSAQFSVADDGTLAYVEGGPQSDDMQTLWVDRTGNLEVLSEHPGPVFNPRLSPDGSKLALSIVTGSNLDIWVLDLRRGNLARWTTHPGEDFGLAWGPGDQVAFSSEIGEELGQLGPGIAWQADSTSDPDYLLRSPGWGNWEFPADWTSDGRLIYKQTREGDHEGIFVLDTRSGRSSAHLDTPFIERAPRLSPDEQWLAYTSSETGRSEVYLRAFPDPGPATQVSIDGGLEPVWSPDGEELFFRRGGQMMVVRPGADPPKTISRPDVLFEGRFEYIDIGASLANYDVSPIDGRFIMIRRRETDLPTMIHVLLNWPATLVTNS